jgi:hypothetical protein
MGGARTAVLMLIAVILWIYDVNTDCGGFGGIMSSGDSIKRFIGLTFAYGMAFVLFAYVLVRYLRVIELSQEGCSIRFWKWKRRYTWHEMSVRKKCQYRKMASLWSRYDNCLLFSLDRPQLRKWEKSRFWMPYLYCDLHLFSSFCVHYRRPEDGESDSFFMSDKEMLDDCHFRMVESDVAYFSDLWNVEIVERTDATA